MDNSAAPIFNICYILPIFQDVAEAIRDGLIELGFATQFSQMTVAHGAHNIIFGAHLINDQSSIPPDSILFNLEQLESGSRYCTEQYFACLAAHTVWDYSQRNIDFLQRRQINPSAVLMPLGFSQALCRIEKPPLQDIDVLFYGAMNPRRQKILEDMHDAGLRVIVLDGVVGTNLDAYIARSKVVLNLHFHATKIFEVVRVGYLLNNKKAVVAEVDTDTEIDLLLRQAVVGVSYDHLVEAALHLLRDDAFRNQVEQNGFALYSQRPQREFLRQIVQHG